MATPSSRLPRAELPEAVVPTKLPLKSVWVAPLVMSTPLPRLPEIRLPWGGRTNTPAVGSLPPVAWPPIRFRAAPFVTRMPFFALPRCERAGGVGADVVHGDLVVVGPVDPDAVAAVAADDVGELEAELTVAWYEKMPEPPMTIPTTWLPATESSLVIAAAGSTPG